jgi:NEDD8-activating enzyme E1 regulatory subunit
MATDNKYDRQLRLWGAHGQRALSIAKICLLNAGPTGTESLKNLVLPGCGHITIVDSKYVTNADLANNFFVEPSSLGKNRGEVVVNLLKEMNPDLQSCSYVNKSPEEIIQQNPIFFTSFSLVLATQLDERSTQILSAVCYSANVPLVLALSNGFIGYLRNVVPEHCILESKPEPAPLVDLRLANPWPELLEFALSFNIETLEPHEHSHVPYVVVLLQLAQVWKNAHNGTLAKSRHEKDEFQIMIKEASMDYQRRMFSNKQQQYEKDMKIYQEALKVKGKSDGAKENDDEIMQPVEVTIRPYWGAELNFTEAYELAYTAHVVRNIPYEVEQLFNENKEFNTNSKTVTFWIVVRAIKEFVANEGNGWLPLNGALPDMTASSDMYIKLQRVYFEKSQNDYQAVLSRVKSIAKNIGIDFNTLIPYPYANTLEGMVKSFCKNANQMQVLRMRSIEDEISMKKDEDGDNLTLNAFNTDIMMKDMDENADSEQACGKWYIMIRSAQLFKAQYSRYPGAKIGGSLSLKEDAGILYNIAVKLCSDLGFDECIVNQKHSIEMTRYGGCEVHNIASFLGGIAAQESVKILTRQYVPLNNTYVYNGINGDGASFML